MATNRVPANLEAKVRALCGLTKPGKAARRPVALVPASLSLTVVVPLRTRSELNLREHWVAKNRRCREAEWAWKCAMPLQWVICAPLPPWRIAFTRLGGRRLDPDAVASCFKHLQDAVCRWLRIDDGDERLSFNYSQEPGRGGYGVRVELRTADESRGGLSRCLTT